MSLERDTIVYNNIWKENHKYNDIPDVIKKLSNCDKQLHVLDLCAGGGRNTVQFLKDGHIVKAIDRNLTAINELMKLKNSYKNLEVKKIDAVDFLNEEKSNFDIVIVFDCIHHFSTDTNNLMENMELIKRRVAEGGKILLTFLADIQYPGGNDSVERLFLDKVSASKILEKSFENDFFPLTRIEEEVYFENAENLLDNKIITGQYHATRLLRVYERKQK